MEYKRELSEGSDGHRPPEKPYNPPAFNVPGVVLALGALMLAINAVVTLLLEDKDYYLVITAFAFIPATMTMPVSELVYPAARFWSPVTHGLLHADWTHVLVNLVWLAAFGSAVARRFGTVRFLVFMILATACGALAHYIFHANELVPVIGASGAVSACMGAATRFAFSPGAMNNPAMTQRPALGLIESLMNKNIMAFVGIWFALNWLFGTGVVPLGDDAPQIAWEAHMGGFVFGLLAFGVFDPIGRSAFQTDRGGE